MRVMAITRAPAAAPLWAMGVAIATAFAQWWPGPPGMFDGKRIETVGTFQEMSPMSSEKPPSRGSGAGPPIRKSPWRACAVSFGECPRRRL